MAALTYFHLHKSFNMTTHESKCVRWKREGAERLAERLSGLNAKEELLFWQEQTKRLKRLQTDVKKRVKESP